MRVTKTAFGVGLRLSVEDARRLNLWTETPRRKGGESGAVEKPASWSGRQRGQRSNLWRLGRFRMVSRCRKRVGARGPGGLPVPGRSHPARQAGPSSCGLAEAGSLLSCRPVGGRRDTGQQPASRTAPGGFKLDLTNDAAGSVEGDVAAEAKRAARTCTGLTVGETPITGTARRDRETDYGPLALHNRAGQLWEERCDLKLVFEYP